jgi:hypothetical protein
LTHTAPRRGKEIHAPPSLSPPGCRLSQITRGEQLRNRGKTLGWG